MGASLQLWTIGVSSLVYGPVVQNDATELDYRDLLIYWQL